METFGLLLLIMVSFAMIHQNQKKRAWKTINISDKEGLGNNYAGGMAAR
jgi:hypothetical protein